MNEFEIVERLMKEDRSFRRFAGSKEIDADVIRRLVGLVRYCASGRNLQPLRYRIVVSAEERDKVFPHLKWAGYLADWDSPEAGECPVAYLIQCLDTRLAKDCMCDDGLHLQAITLGARALGIGGCIIKAFNAAGVRKELGLEEWYEPRHVLAMGYPVEKVEIEDMSGSSDADYRYYRTPDGVHHVPKRLPDELIIG